MREYRALQIGKRLLHYRTSAFTRTLLSVVSGGGAPCVVPLLLETVFESFSTPRNHIPSCSFNGAARTDRCCILGKRWQS